MNWDYLFVAFSSMLMSCYAVVFNFFPRSVFSELERRELISAPVFTADRLIEGTYTEEVSKWYSDTEPYRDFWMLFNMQLQSAQEWHFEQSGEERVVFHAPEVEEIEEEEVAELSNQREFGQFDRDMSANLNAKVANAGIIVVGEAPTARALMGFRGTYKGGTSWVNSINAYRQVLGDSIRIYCMIMPTSTEYYCPAKVRKLVSSQHDVIEGVYSMLDSTIEAVDVYTTLGEHADEPIYFRTDHHWSPLGAFYASQQFARVAGVPVPDLEDFDVETMPEYLGSMYGFSKDIAVKQSPEDFVYYKPRCNYRCFITQFSVDSRYHPNGVYPEREMPFFRNDMLTRSAAYCVFMGGDANITRVCTEVNNGRRLLLLKDSYGNAMPSNLFGSFEEVHVVDFRFFHKSLPVYIREHGITDVLFTNNMMNICGKAAARAYARFMGPNPEGDTIKVKR